MKNKDDRFKPCPFCGHKGARITERKQYIRSGHYKYDADFLTEKWLKKETYELLDDFVQEVVVKVHANIMCNACKARGGTAVGYVEGYPRPSEEMKKRYNCETYDSVHRRAMDAWNKSAEEYEYVKACADQFLADYRMVQANHDSLVTKYGDLLGRAYKYYTAAKVSGFHFYDEQLENMKLENKICTVD